ncbi:MAG TPA: ferritin-like domain-containing protein [Acidimicrobiales bacterium]|nr:ferritin-like domain-containing protein [Acidimicrobiales bacterium]
MQVRADVRSEFTWDYEQTRSGLVKLYEKGKRSQWNATTDIDWTPEVNFGAPSEDGFGGIFGGGGPASDGLFARLDEGMRNQLRWEFQSWMVSQFMHGEQGALLATARLVETVPDIDSKFYAANQVADEARHVEAYARYLNTKLGQSYPISAPLEALLTDIMSESRWDITYLGMQILVEGLALAAFGLGNAIFQDPIIKQITDYVMRDEARHVAFGVLSLQDLYPQMSSSELAEREEFLLTASQLMYDRFLLEQVWERVGIPVEEGKRFAADNPLMAVFRQMLFSKIVPNLRKLGLLTPRVRELYQGLNILQFESAPDSAEEVA